MPNGDPETEALAKELGAETTEPPKPDATPKTPPKGEETPKPPDDTKGAKPPEGKKKGDGEKDDGETPPDPLKGLDLKDILAHPVLGPKFNRWADDAAKHQVDAATRGVKDTATAEAQKAQEAKEDKFFGELSKEELDKELAADPDCAAAYGKYRLRKEQAAKGPTPEETNYNIQVAATRSLVATYREMVDGSDLSDEVKKELQPEEFTKYGAEAVVKWGKAVYEAHIKHGVDLAVESAVEEALAKLDPERKGSGGGRPPGAIPDLMATPSEVGLEAALAAEEQKKK